MKKTTILTATALIAAIAATATISHAKGRHGPRIDLTEMDANNDGSITMAEVSAFQTAKFNEADADADGALSKEELLAVFAARHDGDMPERAQARLDRMFAKMDADDSGTLTLDEQSSEDRITRMFDRLDTDDDGAISAEELQEAKARHGDRGKRGGKGKRDAAASDNG